ncbi:MAG: prolyl-tRNA synthetase associated domain-containing protein [Tissierellia bacterium]|nr:prolyl-tRNA synthetase associated domain-containing protein [Tissierellia bacterium]
MAYTKEKVYELLAEKGIRYDVKEHEPVLTMEDMEKLGLLEKGTVCKNLFLRDAKGKKHFLVTVPDAKQVDLKSLGEKLGTRLSFASAERLQKYLGIETGCVSPLASLNDTDKAVTIVLDRDLSGDPAIGVHPNDNTATIWLSFDDLKSIIESDGRKIRLITV